MPKKTLLYLATLALWFIPPVLLFALHLSSSGFKGDVYIASLAKSVKATYGVAAESPKTSASPIGVDTPNLFTVDQRSVNNLIADLGRFFPALGLESSMFRYELSVKNESLLKADLSHSPDPTDAKEMVLEAKMNCRGMDIPFGKDVVLARDLYLSDNDDGGKDYAGKVAGDCLSNLSLAAQNKSGEPYYLIGEPTATGTVQVLIRPDALSILLMAVAWFIGWSGFLIVVREGVAKSLRSKEIL